MHADIFWVAVVVWAGSVARTAVGVFQGERFSQELLIAALLVVGLPWSLAAAARRGAL